MPLQIDGSPQAVQVGDVTFDEPNLGQPLGRQDEP